MLKFTRNLSRITGAITDPAVLANLELEATPAGLGEAADRYLDAHGYDAGAKLHFAHAYRTSNTIDEFVTYLCSKGMPRAEAEWFFDYILHVNL